MFKLTPNGKETVLYSFRSFRPGHGRLPAGSLLLEGNELYGTTTAGGKYNDGLVFRLRK